MCFRCRNLKGSLGDRIVLRKCFALPTLLMSQFFVSSGLADVVDEVALAIGAGIESLITANPQLRQLDMYSILAVRKGRLPRARPLYCKNTCKQKQRIMNAIDVLTSAHPAGCTTRLSSITPTFLRPRAFPSLQTARIWLLHAWN